MAHEIKNPLNGLALNLEVVRSRAARGGVDAAALAPYADVAASELRRGTELIESLLALARPARAPVDLWDVLQPLIRLYDAVAAAAGGEVTMERPADARFETIVEGDVARAALATALEALVQGSNRVRGSVLRRGDVIAVEFRGAEPPAPVAEPVRAACGESNIEFRRSPTGLTLLFAARAREDTTGHHAESQDSDR